MRKRLENVLESLVIAAILLVLVQTFLEDFAVLAGWEMGVRSGLALAGFSFDLFFTVEFLVRLYSAATRGRSLGYLTRERGWIDFLASVPLLMFSSGPLAIALLSGGAAAAGAGGIFNLLKVIKAVRIARVLRFLRVLKIFRGIRYVDSTMAQRHVSTVTSIGVNVLVFSLLAFTLVIGAVRTGGLEDRFYAQRDAAAGRLAEAWKDPPEFERTLDVLARVDADLLVVRTGERIVYSRYGDDYYRRYFAPGEYGFASAGALGVYFDLRPVARNQSRENLLFFSIVLLLVLAYLLVYSPLFAMGVTDPLHVMVRGMSDRKYNLEVRIPESYIEDEVFQLANLYNERYLPLKNRTLAQSGAAGEADLLELGQDDILELLEEEHT